MDASLTREPEMVKTCRDTWKLGLHSYLTYLRDRLLVARDLLKPEGRLTTNLSSGARCDLVGQPTCDTPWPSLFDDRDREQCSRRACYARRL